MLILAFVVQPAMAAIGEAHDLSHHRVAADHAKIHSSEDPMQELGIPDKDGEALHFLAHLAHCYNHASSMLPDTTDCVMPAPDSVKPVPKCTTLVLRNPLNDVLRPPIPA